MANLPDWFFEPRRLDGGAVRAVKTEDGGFAVLDWNGKAWVPAVGVDMADMMEARLAAPEFLARLGVPSTPASSAA